MADTNSCFQQFRERKRSRNEIKEAFLKLSNLSIADMEQHFTDGWLDQSQMLALLVMHFGVMSLLLARYAINKIPATMPVDMKQNIFTALFPSQTTAEVDFLITNLPRVSEFMTSATLEDNVHKACLSTGIPFYEIICPPVEKCVKCDRKLTIHNQPAQVTIFKLTGPVPGLKLTSKCQRCGLIYKYAQYGNKSEGFQFYPERRPLIEASNVAYLERQLCLYQVFLR